MDNWDFHTQSVKCSNYFRKQFVSFKHGSTLWLINFTSRNSPKISKNICPHIDLYTNVPAVLYTIVQNWKQPKCLSTRELWYTFEYHLTIKETNYCYIQKHDWISKTLCCTREVRHKRKQTIQHLHKFPEEAKVNHTNKSEQGYLG